jgi:hypothetical protein
VVLNRREDKANVYYTIMCRDSGIYCDMLTFDTVKERHSARKLTDAIVTKFLVSSARDYYGLFVRQWNSTGFLDSKYAVDIISPHQVVELVIRSLQVLHETIRLGRGGRNKSIDPQ